MIQSLGRWLDRFIPLTHRADPQTVWRSRFLIHSAALGMVVASLASGVYAVGGWWPGAFGAAALALTLPLAVVALRVTKSTVVGAHLGLGLMLITFTLPTLFERELDGALLALFALFPYLAVLLLDGRAAWVWLGLILVTLAGIVVSHEFALLPTLPVAHPDFVTLMRVAMLVACVFFLGQRFAAERQRAMLDVERLSLARGAFLANMSHEIRTPMNGVLGLTEVMLQEELAPSIRERLELVHRSGQSLVALINDLLDFSKLEARKLSVEHVDFELGALLSDLEQLFQPVAAQKGLAFGVHRVGVPLVVRGDPLRLRQVLSNLLNNALKFTERGSVELEVSRTAGAVPVLHFEVRDTGVGIAAEVLPRLFLPFEQADASTTRRFGGTGLGLALSLQLVELMGGHLEVASTWGLGSVFSFTLELVEGRAIEPVPEVADGPARPGRSPVLVVDDNAINLKVATAMVERVGFVVVTATNGREAFELVERGVFMAVLMDCHMPVMDGFEATQRIRALSGPMANVPIIAVTASAMPEELAACRRSGMNDCLVKPISLAMLRKVLARVSSQVSAEG